MVENYAKPEVIRQQGIMKKLNFQNDVILVSILFLGIVLKITPHPSNFCPILALIAFLFRYFSFARAFLAVMVMLISSDAFLLFYNVYSFNWNWAFPVYASYFIIGLLVNILFHSRLKIGFWVTLIFTGLISPFLFWVLTNLFLWGQANFYPFTFQGLILCLTLALPFLPPLILSNLLTAYFLELFLSYKSQFPNFRNTKFKSSNEGYFINDVNDGPY